jgi:hypothetical protein
MSFSNTAKAHPDPAKRKKKPNVKRPMPKNLIVYQFVPGI